MRPQGSSRAKRRTVMAVLIYIVFFSVGTFGHYFEATRALMLNITPAILLVFGLSALIPVIFAGAWHVLLWATGTFVMTFALEALGVATGVIFGDYAYGPTLGVKLLGVPLIIGFNWVIVVLGSVICADMLLLRRFDGRPWTRVAAPVVVGAMAVGFDLVLEPVAIALGYWHWAAISVPVRNYVAWFVIAAAAAVPYFSMRDRAQTALVPLYVAVQFLFMLSLLPLALGGVL